MRQQSERHSPHHIGHDKSGVLVPSGHRSFNKNSVFDAAFLWREAGVRGATGLLVVYFGLERKSLIIKNWGFPQTV